MNTYLKEMNTYLKKKKMKLDMIFCVEQTFEGFWIVSFYQNIYFFE